MAYYYDIKGPGDGTGTVGSARVTFHTLRSFLTDNKRGTSICIRSTSYALFAASVLAFIGVLNFLDPGTFTMRKTLLLTLLGCQILVTLAITTLPWRILLAPFHCLPADEIAIQEVQPFSYDRNLQLLQHDIEAGSTGSLVHLLPSPPEPLIKRSFTVLKTAVRPGSKAPTANFRVICVDKGAIPQRKSSQKYAEVYRNPKFNLNTGDPFPTRSRRGTLGSDKQPTPILRITHPLETLTCHPPMNVDRRNTLKLVKHEVLAPKHQKVLEKHNSVASSLRQMTQDSWASNDEKVDIFSGIVNESITTQETSNNNPSDVPSLSRRNEDVTFC